MRAFAGMFIGGIATLFLLKLLAGLFLPLLGMAFGFLAMLFKLMVLGAILWFVYTIVRSRRRRGEV